MVCPISAFDDIRGRITKRSAEFIESFINVAMLIFTFAFLWPHFIKNGGEMMTVLIMMLYGELC